MEEKLNDENVEKKETTRKYTRKKTKTIKKVINEKVSNKKATFISNKNIFEQYLLDNNPFRIYLDGQVIYDSEKQKNKPQFFDDYFILFDFKYIYKGIRIEKYTK